MSIYNIVASTDEATVVAEYAAEYNVRPEKYQSEAELERDFIRQLTSQGYEYISVHNEAALIENLRKQLELLNDFTFTDSEWDRFFTECIANTNEGIVNLSPYRADFFNPHIHMLSMNKWDIQVRALTPLNILSFS